MKDPSQILLRMGGFWERNPAFFFGLALFLGSIFVLQTPWALLPFVLLLFPKKFFIRAVILFVLPSCFIYHFYTFPPPYSPAEGLFYIQSVKQSERFGKGWSYQGILKTERKRVYCHCFSKQYYPTDALYKVSGSFESAHGKFYKLKTTEPWKFVKERYTLNPWRCKAKDSVKNYIHKHISQKRAALFLIGMTTGELEDRIMKNELGELGLSHLMAISGLHFSLLALTFHLLFRLFLPHKIEALCLMGLLTLYLLFIGDTPSILRAWIAVMVFLSGQLLERRPTAINSLGVSLLLSLIWNPLSATTLSFQLSFLATGGILFFYSPCERIVGTWLPKKPLTEVASKHWLWQHGYIFISFFREAFALSLAVHLSILPLILTVFHTFSINSLIYNLFFPFLASLALLFFLASLVLGHWAHVINGYYCEWILQIPAEPPLLFRSFYLEHMPPWLLAMLLTTLLLAAISYQARKGDDSSLFEGMNRIL